ncbi:MULTISPECIES: beta-phosphoglucomutase [Robiginitalea]|uniref:Beta-phosphoglucomutase n=1 Tax=Robiginitalea biformata (strain ATCC BAA-864 / DSM 15991 / KCTC 12146 / HTCC2501) TaxID=313596 RepID=A4CJ39_ROBBH|nr:MULTISPECIES: beta-phosphoglucomutase [Robiginitalea]EAR16947.1 predicted phosphatase/phosphohexomutase [Robiginitalea biformata HTCC2501]MDC6352849.1 beta-phosphoglucomutase [Robiginitalea sp. PM2]MDC6373985.1 beta-phosphoglucomutase [Robiginitalea sp. SP8]
MRGFIFDLDGVIVDTAKYHYLAWKHLADELGITFTEEDNERFKGVSRKRCLEILLEMGGMEVSGEQFNRWLHEKNEDYLSHISKMDASEILPDVPRVLDYLRDRNIPMALGSASKNARPILEKVGLLSYFNTIVDGNEVVKAKPDPQVFLLAAERLGVSPNQCVVFEDALAGIEAANKAGMQSIGIGDPDILTEADAVFRDFTEIDVDYLRGLLAGSQ